LTEHPPSRKAATPGAVDAGRRLRLARLTAGLTQSQLADLCGVSRQAVSGAEAGSWSPSLGIALQLARVLGTSVDQLFAVEPQPREAVTTALGLGPPTARVRTALVWDRWVALPLTEDRAMITGFTAATGRLVKAGEAQIWGSGRSLVIAGCDPALALLAEPVEAARDGWTVEWWACSSGNAKELLDAGLIHAAAVHRSKGKTAAGGKVRSRARIGFASWREGVLLRPSAATDQPRSLEDVLRRDPRWVNREVGSEARTLLDRELARLNISGAALDGYASHAAGHLQVASAIASGTADAGIATEPAALAYGLNFLALSDEECVLHVDRDRLDTIEIRLLLDALGGPGLGRELAALPGYDTAILGLEL